MIFFKYTYLDKKNIFIVIIKNNIIKDKLIIY